MESIRIERGQWHGGPWHARRKGVWLSGGPDEGPHGEPGDGPPFVRHVHFRKHGGGPFGFDPRRRFRGRDGGGPRVGRGDVRAATLLLLAERPLHGYQVIQEIGERSGGIWRPSPGSVYPALQLLEDEGLIRAEQEEGRRVFHLTDTGRAYVEERRGELVAARDAVTGNVDTEVLALHDLFRQTGAAVEQVAHAGTPAQVAAARELLVNTRRQLYRILAEDDAAGTDRT